MTVGELRQRMTLEEFKRWKLYEEEMGPLHLGIRIERIVSLVGAPHLKGNPVRKLMAWPRSQAEEEEGSIEQAFGILMNAFKANEQKKKGGDQQPRKRRRKKRGKS